ncbi:MAG: sugar nucleotide-binding protein, partial [Opitutales bacterium]|nr:sugar nucleotide-binding protein [Opitutales bacterium]
MKVIITGAAGFLGRETVFSALRRGFDVTAVFHKNEVFLPQSVQRVRMDLTDTGTLQSFILQEFPDAVINCAGITSIAEAEATPARAEQLNAALPRTLA